VTHEPDPAVDDAATPAERGRSLRSAATLTAGVGIAFSILFTISFVLALAVPGRTSTDEEIYDYYASSARTTLVIVGLYLLPFAGIAFLWFIVALPMWAAASTRVLSELQSNLQLVSGILFVGLLFVGAAATTVLAISAEYATGPVDPVAARQFPIFGGSIIVFFAMRMAAMFVFTTSALGRSARILPVWFAWVGYGMGLFLLLVPIIATLLMLVFPAWVLALSVILLRRAREIPKDEWLPPGSGLSPIRIPHRGRGRS
jgi:hypothetical protein